MTFRRGFVFALAVRGARYLIAIAAFVLLPPASAAAASPQIYIGGNPDYTVAFKAEAGTTSVLALDAPLYCSETEPSRKFGPGYISVFKAPTSMHQGANGLEVLLGGGGGPSSKIEAAFDGGAFAGTFAFDFSEGSFHCQTAGFYPARRAVQFKAVRYEPFGTGTTKPAGKGEVPVYFGSEAGTEVVVEATPESIVFRGAAPSRCPVAGKRPKEPRTPLFGDVTDVNRVENDLHRTISRRGRVGTKAWSETTSVVGSIDGETIAGTYRRSTTVRPEHGKPRRCTTGALPFRAVRYLPAVGS